MSEQQAGAAERAVAAPAVTGHAPCFEPVLVGSMSEDRGMSGLAGLPEAPLARGLGK